eukprot:1149897-Prymnesium_polylepis.1
MARAAALLEGTHDFGAFQASRGDQKGTVRTVYRCAVEPRGSSAAGVDEEASYDIVVEGDGFLYKQVRIMAGTLVMVGMGLAPPETVLVALSSEKVVEGGEGSGTPQSELRRRGVVGPTLPPERLCLEHIEYERDHDAHRDERARTQLSLSSPST